MNVRHHDDARAPLGRLRLALARPVSPLSLAMLRIGFGLSVAWMVGVYLLPGRDGRTGVYHRLTDPQIGWHFPYPGLSWIEPLPEPLTTLAFAFCAAAACALAAGVAYRASAVALWLSLNYAWLIDQTMHGNHYTLASVLSFLLIWVPADRALTLPAAWRRPKGGPLEPLPSIPFWPIALLRAQLIVLYTYSGLHKLHPDWLAGEPLRLWFTSGMVSQRIAEHFGPGAAGAMAWWCQSDTAGWLVSYAGLVFDLSVGWLLLWRRTRYFALALATFFHLFNYLLIDRVAVVAPMAWWATLIFLEPDWPRRLADWLRQPRLSRPDWGWLIAGAVLVPPAGALLGWRAAAAAEPPQTRRPVSRGLLALVCVWLAAQNVIAARHWFIPGDGYWTEEGMRFSWALMTKNKVGDFVRFRVEPDPWPAEAAPGLHRAETGAAGGGGSDAADTLDPSTALAEQLRPIYVQVSARHVDFRRLPRFFVSYEPILGERVIFNPLAADSAPAAPPGDPVAATALVSADQALARESWRQRFGREPQVVPVQPLAAILDEIKAQLGSAGQASAQAVDELVGPALERRQALVDRATDDVAAHRPARGLVNRLNQLLLATRGVAGLAESFLLVRPFDIQGNAAGQRLYLVIDRATQAPGDGVLWSVDHQTWPASQEIYADLDLLMAANWRPLPAIVASRNPAGRLEFFWNPTRELTSRQLEDLAIMPGLLHSYAGHVAEAWENRFGIRPRVYARAYAQLNHHPLQPLVDEATELGNARLRILGHNPWIAPLERADPTVEHTY